MPPVKIRNVHSVEDIRRFAGFPFSLYKDCPWWIPPIKKAEEAMLDPGKNPAFQHCETSLWLAEKDGRIAGRIGCFINEMETQMRGEKQARFNWIDFEDDPEVSKALLETAENWAREKGAARLKGPLGFTNFDAAGLTVEGFEELGSMGAPYHFPYYKDHLEAAGYGKATDYLEIVVEEVPEGMPEKLQRLRPIVEQKFGLRLEHLKNRSELKSMVSRLFGLIIDTYKGLPSFVPLSDRQVDYYVQQNLPFLNLEYLPLVKDREGNIVGYGVITPSFSRALQRAGGKLYPFGLLHLLWTRRYHNAVNLVLIGVVDEWRNKGLNALLFGETIPVFNRKGVKKVYINPILEENQASLALFKDYGPRVFRRRRVFGKDL
ncbi:MAG: hypothetical protein WA004_04615 [Saprospiraceae bacterium]